MLISVRELIKCLSIFILMLLVLVSFIECNGSLKGQFKTGLKTGGLSIVIIYLFSI